MIRVTRWHNYCALKISGTKKNLVIWQDSQGWRAFTDLYKSLDEVLDYAGVTMWR